MTPARRLAPAVCAAVGTVVLLAGCGGPPENASKKEFCGQLEEVNTQKSWKATKKAVADLQEIGTPEGISKDARAGFLELAANTESSKNREALLATIEKLDKEDRRQLTAFNDYVTRTC